MQGDFSVLNFDPYQHRRGVSPARNGVLRNVNGVLQQQGRVTLDADLTDGELLDLGWQEQSGRDIIGAGVAAVPATEPDGFRIDAALVDGTDVHVRVRPGRVWADGILTRLAGDVANPTASVERTAAYFGPPLSDPTPTTDSIGDLVRDAVILEVSEESLHGFQYPERLIEPALGGPDTAERSYVNYRFRLIRLGPDEDCRTILGKLGDDPSSKGKLSVTLAPAVVIAGDCPVVGGGGYTGFEHFLYRIEIADTNGPARFKWSQWNGGLAGRGRFDATVTPAKVVIDAGRTPIVSSGLAEFYLEALQYDDLVGAWRVTYGATATLNTDHDLELAAPPVFGTLPSTTDPVFFRLWNGLEAITDFTNTSTPQELRDGIRLVFDPPAAGNYRPGDYWTFAVRAGEIPNAPVLIDHAAPFGIAYHRVPLAEINWTAQKNTTIDGSIEDCRIRFRPLTNQKICCTYLIGDGVTSFGDFNSLEEAAAHLPSAGGELCLLPGVHRANLVLTGRQNVTIHGCDRRSAVLPRSGAQGAPIIHLVDCVGIRLCNLDLLTFDGTALIVEGQKTGSCRDVRIEEARMIGRVNAIRVTNAAEIVIANNRLHLLDTVEGFATISVAADDALIERNALLIMPFVEPPGDAGTTGGDPAPDPADPCAKPEVIYAKPTVALAYAAKVFTLDLAILASAQPFRAFGGIHVRGGSSRVRIIENTIVGGAGNGVTLGGDIDPPPPILLTDVAIGSAAGVVKSARTSATPAASSSLTDRGRFQTAAQQFSKLQSDASPAARTSAAVNVTEKGQFLALVQDKAGKPLADIDVYLEGPMTASDRSDAQGIASIKATPGRYTLDVSPRFEVVSVSETRDLGVLINVVTIAPAAAAASTGTGFLFQIAIQKNDISFMGLSGIGFALREGAVLGKTAATSQPTGPKSALVVVANALAKSISVGDLFKATTPVVGLEIVGNRIHNNLQNPFTDRMRADAQLFGRGGISLGAVGVAVISENQIQENGRSAIDPICGVFLGYGDIIEITNNLVAANGLVPIDFEQNVQQGVRGGLFIQFAGALSVDTPSIGHLPAIRLHGNRVDQTAGLALTLSAFGPVSCVNNHFNSERSVRTPGDPFAGCVFIANFGPQALISRLAGSFMGAAAAAATHVFPTGQTLIQGNYLRIGPQNGAVSTLLAGGIDVDYSANSAVALPPERPFQVNVSLVGASVRAIGNRFQEEIAHGGSLSTISLAFGMNITTLNQADHCITAAPPPVPGNDRPTVVRPNQILDFGFCNELHAATFGVEPLVAQALAARATDLGVALSVDDLTRAGFEEVSRQLLASALAVAAETNVARTRAYQAEAARLSATLGATHPRVVAMNAQTDAGAELSRLVAISAEAVTAQAPAATSRTSSISGRFVNEKGRGQADLTVELVRVDGTRVVLVGRTDEAGFYSSAFDASRTASLANEGKLYLRFLDESGNEMMRAKDAVTIRPGADIRSTVTVPMRVVPKSVVSTGTVIFDNPKGNQSRAPESSRPRPSTTGTPPERPSTHKKRQRKKKE